MRALYLGGGGGAAPERILAIGAHCDDIEIGCGATLARLRAERPNARVAYVVFCAAGERGREAGRAAQALLGPALETFVGFEFEDSFLPFSGDAVKRRMEELTRFSPDLILTHHRQDAHQDHRLLGELTRCAFRSHLILEYEIPKYDGDLGRPNAYVPLTRAQSEAKIALLFEAFPSQAHKPWFDAETFRGLMRLRGMECNAPEGYAEAFHAPKMTLGL